MATTTFNAAGSDPILVLQANGGGTERFTVNSTGQIQTINGTVGAPSLSFSSDLDTGIYRSGANLLAFSTNGAKKLEIGNTNNAVTILSGSSDGSGQHLIFSQLDTNQSTLLALYNEHTASRTAIRTGLMFRNYSTTGLASVLFFKYAGGYSGNDDAGIPYSNSFQIFPGGENIGHWIWNFGNPTNDALYFEGGSTPAVKAKFIVSNGGWQVSDGSAGSPSLSFINDTNTGFYRIGTDILGFSTAGTERLRITSAGLVGIGATSPAAFLHIKGDSSSHTLLELDDTPRTNGKRWGVGPGIEVAGRLSIKNISDNKTALTMYYDSVNETKLAQFGATTRQSTGHEYLGVGQFGVVGSAETGNSLLLRVGHGANEGLINWTAINEAETDGFATGYFRCAKVSGEDKGKMDIGVNNGTTLTAIVHITPDLRVGISTATPAYKLDVAGDCHATSFPTSSDDRLKKDIAPLSNALEKIKAIKGVLFNWNETYEKLGRSSGRREIGVLAQNVEEVFPELITKWGNEKYRAVDYGRLTAVLLEAVKELDEKVSEVMRRKTR